MGIVREMQQQKCGEGLQLGLGYDDIDNINRK